MNTTVDPSATNPDPLLTVDEAATYLGMSPTFVYRQLRAGRLRPTYLGRYLRVRRSAIEAYLTAASRDRA